MKNKSIFYLCLFLLLLPTFSRDGFGQSEVDYAKMPLTANGEYRIVRRIALKNPAGRLEVLRDARLTADVSFSQDRFNAPEIDSSNEKLKAEFAKTPIRPAVVRTVDARGKIVDSKELACVEAGIEIVGLYKNAVPTYRVVCQYYGPSLAGGAVSSFVEIAAGRLAWLAAINRKTGKRTPIELLDERQETWKFRRTAAGRDILAVATGWYDDGDGGGNFQLLYRRFHFDGRRWLVFERLRRDDYWDDDLPFPKIARFPKAER